MSDRTLFRSKNTQYLHVSFLFSNDTLAILKNIWLVWKACGRVLMTRLWQVGNRDYKLFCWPVNRVKLLFELGLYTLRLIHLNVTSNFILFWKLFIDFYQQPVYLQYNYEVIVVRRRKMKFWGYIHLHTKQIQEPVKLKHF